MHQHSGYLVRQVVQDFEFEACLNRWFGRPEVVSRQVIRWTEGQPFLTHRLFQVVLRSLRQHPQRSLREFQALSAKAASEHQASEHQASEHQASEYPPEAEWLDRLVQHQCVDRCTDLELRKHLRQLCKTILADPGLMQLLDTYQQVLRGDRGSCDRLSSAQLRLVQTGLVRPSQGQLVIGNRLYQAIFDQAWLNRAFKTASSSSTHSMRRGVLDDGTQGRPERVKPAQPPTEPSNRLPEGFTERFPERSMPAAAQRLGVALVICTLGAVVILALTYLGKRGEPELSVPPNGLELQQD